MRAQFNDVTVKTGARIVTATVDGCRYQIPEIWLMGMCRDGSRTPEDAVGYWHQQSRMESAFNDGR
jgi:hypothetical protein